MSIRQIREEAYKLCELATGYGKGRTVDDPIYQEIVEGRDPGPVYSSCADLAHWMLYRLGCREEFINRDEHLGWRSIVNVARLTAPPVGSNSFAEPNPTDAQLVNADTGDIIVMWDRRDVTDAHVCVLDTYDGYTLSTWDLGQGPIKKSRWRWKKDHVEACRKHRTEWKQIRSILSLADLEFEEDLMSRHILNA